MICYLCMMLKKKRKKFIFSFSYVIKINIIIYVMQYYAIIRIVRRKILKNKDKENNKRK